MSIVSTCQKWWVGHGTKILGGIAMLIGAAGECLALIQTVDPKHAALWALVIGLGGAIVRRGFTNTAQIATTSGSPSATPTSGIAR